MRFAAAPIRARGIRAGAAAFSAAGLVLCASFPAAAQTPPPSGEPRRMPGEGIEMVAPESYKNAGANTLIQAIAPPPPSTVQRCPDQPKCPPESEQPQLAFLFVGLATAGMLLSTSWGLLQQKKAKLIREELSRIRIHRTAKIRAQQTLGEVSMPPPGLGRVPSPRPDAPAGPKVPLAPFAAEQRDAGTTAAAVAAAGPLLPEPDQDQLREEAESRLATAQAELGPLLATARATEEWFRTREFDGVLSAAGPARQFFDRVHRGVIAVSATFHALREARIFPRSLTAIDDEIEGYWEQVYESLDDVYLLVNMLASEEGRRAVAATPSAEAVRAQVDRLLEAARQYLASDQRRPIPIEPLRTDFDRRIHHSVEARKVAGVPPDKILSVLRCGIIRDGKLVRKPEVIQSL